MFAIQSGSKFVNPDYLRTNDVYAFTVSAYPNMVVSKKDADTLFASTNKYLTETVTWHKNHIAREEAAIAKAQARAEFLRKKLIDLGKKPYKEVGQQIKRAQDEIERCEDKIKGNAQSLKDFRRELTRVEGVQRTGIKLVKFAATAV